MDFNPWRHDNDETDDLLFALELGKTLGVKLFNKESKSSSRLRIGPTGSTSRECNWSLVGGLLHFGAKKLRVTVDGATSGRKESCIIISAGHYPRR